MVDSKQYWVKTPQSGPSPASGGRNSSAAYFLGHYQTKNGFCQNVRCVARRALGWRIVAGLGCSFNHASRADGALTFLCFAKEK